MEENLVVFILFLEPVKGDIFCQFFTQAGNFNDEFGVDVLKVLGDSICNLAL